MERYARTTAQIIEETGDQVELCRRFINTDSLAFTKSQISPFTRTKVKKGTPEYNKTLDNCDYLVKKDYVEKTKSSKVSDKMETILSLIGSTMSQSERRNLFSAVPVVGVSQRTKKNLEVERNRELLKLPLFQKYNSPYPDGIAFTKMETEVLPPESYPIFLKYLSKGVSIPKEIEDLFDNPPDPKFYSKLLRIAIKQKVKIGDHLLMIMIHNKVNPNQILQYYINVLRRPIPEDAITNIKNPIIVLEYQKITNNRAFEGLMGNLKKLTPKLLKLLLERYSNDIMKLFIIYYTLLRLRYRSEAEKIESKLEENLKLKDLESFITYMDSIEANKLLSIIYIKILGKTDPSDIDLDILREMVINIEDIDLKLELLKLYIKLNGMDISFLSEFYAGLNVTDAKKFEALKTIFEMLGDPEELSELLQILNIDYDINYNNLIEVLKDRRDELPQFVRMYFIL